MTLDEYEAEIRRLHRFILKLAEHLADAAEVLANLAERRESGRGRAARDVLNLEK